jgi:hypothetical protein
MVQRRGLRRIAATSDSFPPGTRNAALPNIPATWRRISIAGTQYSVFADRATDTVRPDADNVFRCWAQSQEPGPSRDAANELVRRIKERGIDVVSLQYNFGFFAPPVVEHLVERLHAAGIAVMITLHSTNHPSFGNLTRALARADAAIVHRQEEFARLVDCGVECAVMQRQGIYVPPVKAEPKALPGSRPLAFTVACFGFFLPPKGIRELLQAFEAAVRVNPVLRLKLVNSLYPGSASATYAAACMRFAEERGLRNTPGFARIFWKRTNSEGTVERGSDRASVHDVHRIVERGHPAAVGFREPPFFVPTCRYSTSFKARYTDTPRRMSRRWPAAFANYPRTRRSSGVLRRARRRSWRSFPGRRSRSASRRWRLPAGGRWMANELPAQPRSMTQEKKSFRTQTFSEKSPLKWNSTDLSGRLDSGAAAL